MDLILLDTSAFIELNRRTRSPTDRTAVRLLGSDAVTITEPVVMEVLAGCRSQRAVREMRAKLLSFPMLRVGGLESYERAAAIHRTCRLRGETVRSFIDCLIAAIAIRENASVLHADRDFDVIARHTDLRIYPAGA